MAEAAVRVIRAMDDEHSGVTLYSMGEQIGEQMGDKRVTVWLLDFRAGFLGRPYGSLELILLHVVPSPNLIPAHQLGRVFGILQLHPSEPPHVVSFSSTNPRTR